jgi:hypothetical protein
MASLEVMLGPSRVIVLRVDGLPTCQILPLSVPLVTECGSRIGHVSAPSGSVAPLAPPAGLSYPIRLAGCG